MTKVFVSGCFDLMHSGHVFFFERAAAYGDLYVAIGSDKTIRELKKREPVCHEDERLYLVSSVRFVHRAFIGSGSGMLDFLPELDIVRPDVFVVNEDGATEEKRRLCEERNIRYGAAAGTEGKTAAPFNDGSAKTGGKVIMRKAGVRPDFAGRAHCQS